MKTDREFIVTIYENDKGAIIEPVRELIRCKDCVYFNGEGTWCDYEMIVNSDDFCSRADRSRHEN